MQIAAYILSCPDREQLRAQTLANLAATDWGEPAMVEIDRTHYERRQERQTETAQRLLQRAVQDGPEFFLFLEDDLDFNAHLRHNLESWYPMRHVAVGGHFFGSLYNPRIRAIEQDHELASFIADPNSVYGSQAFVLSAATARHILEHWESQIGMQDIKLSRLAAQVTPIFYHYPSLVQHIGVESAWGGPYHRALDFQQEWRANDQNSRVSSAFILAEMKRVEGWLDDVEAKLLIDTVVSIASSRQPCSIVEVGSYCGKSTIVLALTLKHLGMLDSRVTAIGPHDGVISVIGGGTSSNGGTFEKFCRNMSVAGVESLVNPIVAQSTDLAWNQYVDLLFVDGLHDYEHVAQDFRHFSPWVQPSGYVAFHDWAPYFPGVKRLVDEIVRSGEYKISASAKSLVVLKKAAARSTASLDDVPDTANTSLGDPMVVQSRATVFSVYMDNVPDDVVRHQRRVVEKFLPTGWEFVQHRSSSHSHGAALTECLGLSPTPIAVFLDIDCVPLRRDALQLLADLAMAGALAGAVQRANHISNGGHLYVAPFCMAFSKQRYVNFGSPTLLDTKRGDTAEELTYCWQQNCAPISFLWPSETRVPEWTLCGSRQFGLGTTYDGKFYHQFRIHTAVAQEEFARKCREILNGNAAPR